jgi:hypothetical protein
MNMPTSVQRKAAGSLQRADVEDLLRRYPDVDAGETDTLLRFLKKGPPLEVALLTTDEELWPRLQRFRQDHRSKFHLGFKEYALVLLILMGLIALCLFLWDVGVR